MRDHDKNESRQDGSDAFQNVHIVFSLVVRRSDGSSSDLAYFNVFAFTGESNSDCLDRHGAGKLSNMSNAGRK